MAVLQNKVVWRGCQPNVGAGLAPAFQHLRATARVAPALQHLRATARVAPALQHLRATARVAPTNTTPNLGGRPDSYRNDPPLRLGINKTYSPVPSTSLGSDT
jgi:hypothetical protein